MSRSKPSSELQARFADTFRALRKVRDLTQEEFDVVSGRTYLSAIERGLKVPTLGKVEDLASVLQVHPLTLLALSYCQDMDEATFRPLWEAVAHEGLVLIQAQQAKSAA